MVRTRVGPQRAPRILQVIDWLEVGGAQQHLLQLARGLSGKGYRCVVATSGREPLAATFRSAGISVRILTPRPIKHRVSPTFIYRLSRLARSGAYDVIHGHLHSASVAAAIAARASGLPLVLTHHSMNTWRSAWQTALGTWADRQAHAVIAVASNLAGAAAERGVYAGVIPNGVPVPARLWTPQRIAEARAALGVPTDAYVVGYVGRFTADKNPSLFVEGAARLAAEYPQAHFLMVGDGPARAATEAQVRELGLAERVVFAGFRADAADLHFAIDTLALTSNSEGAPLVVLEAMARGRPVVATAVGDVPRQLVDGETGFLVPPGDVEALTAALGRLTDPSARARLGQAARSRAQAEFSAERWIARTSAVLESALGRERRAVPAAAPAVPLEVAPSQSGWARRPTAGAPLSAVAGAASGTAGAAATEPGAARHTA